MVLECLLGVVLCAVEVAAGQGALGQIDEQFLALTLVHQLWSAALQERNGGGKLLLLGDVDVVQPVGIGLIEAYLVVFEGYQLVVKIAGEDKALAGGIPGVLFLWFIRSFGPPSIRASMALMSDSVSSRPMSKR